MEKNAPPNLRNLLIKKSEIILINKQQALMYIYMKIKTTLLLIYIFWLLTTKLYTNINDAQRFTSVERI